MSIKRMQSDAAKAALLSAALGDKSRLIND